MAALNAFNEAATPLGFGGVRATPDHLARVMEPTREARIRSDLALLAGIQGAP
jgi:hypothetical protein